MPTHPVDLTELETIKVVFGAHRHPDLKQIHTKLNNIYSFRLYDLDFLFDQSDDQQRIVVHNAFDQLCDCIVDSIQSYAAPTAYPDRVRDVLMQCPLRVIYDDLDFTDLQDTWDLEATIAQTLCNQQTELRVSIDPNILYFNIHDADFDLLNWECMSLDPFPKPPPTSGPVSISPPTQVPVTTPTTPFFPVVSESLLAPTDLPKFGELSSAAVLSLVTDLHCSRNAASLASLAPLTLKVLSTLVSTLPDFYLGLP